MHVPFCLPSSHFMKTFSLLSWLVTLSKQRVLLGFVGAIWPDAFVCILDFCRRLEWDAQSFGTHGWCTFLSYGIPVSKSRPSVINQHIKFVSLSFNIFSFHSTPENPAAFVLALWRINLNKFTSAHAQHFND